MRRIWLLFALALISAAFGCKFEWKEEETPRVHPVAVIETSGESGTAPYAVILDGSNSFTELGSLTSYWWIFGDGGETAGPTVAHTFASAGTYEVMLVVTNSLDLASQAEVIISVAPGGGNAPPAADISAGPLTGEAPLEVSFDGTGSSDPDGSVTGYTWHFGDGGAATGATVSHTYTAAGTFNAILVVTDDAGSSGSASVTVTITGIANQPPAASISADPSTGTAPLEVTFSGSASSDTDGYIADYSWDFGDGATGSGVSVSHTYSAGSYTATLTVTDNAGDTDTATVDISVNARPVAAIDANPTSGYAPLTVNFDGSASTDSDGTIVDYAWDFGDGGTASGAGASHSYTAAGQYTAMLVVTDDSGATDSALVLVTVTAVPNEPPTAAASANPTSGDAPLTVDFDGSGSTDSDGSIVDYTWYFGDGTTATGVSASHEYTAPGTYTASLVVTDDGGASDTASVTITVADPAPNEPPSAVISADPTSGDAPLTVDFDGSGSTDSDGTISQYNWDFGDGQTDSGATVSHTYTLAGTYVARLTVVDNLGAEGYETVTITVLGEGPTAVVQADLYHGVADLSVNFSGTGSTGGGAAIQSFNWSFGDGGSSASVSPSHTFDAGVYWVTLTVTDTTGSTDQARTVIAVASWDEEVVRLTNVERWSADGGAHLPPLKKEWHIDAAALRHSTDMAINDFFDHTGSDGSSPGDRMSDAGYNWFTCGENIAAGYTSPAAVVAGWMASPGHHANIMYPTFREIGVSYVYYASSTYRRYWTQDFGASWDIYPVVINREEFATNSQTVNLYIYGSGWADSMMVSNFSDFAGASWESPAANKTWTLDAGLGVKSVHVKLRSGATERTYSDSIAVVEQ